MVNVREKFSFLTSANFITIIFLFFLSIVELLFSFRLQQYLFYLPLNITLILFIFFTGKFLSQRKKKTPTLLSRIYDWYLIPNILFIYTQASSIAFPLHSRDFDPILSSIDFWIFGVHPTQWIYTFSHPVITEILQIAYSSYYLFFVALFFEFYRKKMINEFNQGAMLVVFGFYLSYVGYMVFPAIGPRFTLHDFQSLNNELPGLFLTPYLRELINAGGGVGSGVNPMLHLHRDAFPSGHTQLTLTAMYIAFKNHTSIRWGLLVVGSLLIISTIYMRYHYVIDILAGTIFFFLTIYLGKKIHSWWENKA